MADKTDILAKYSGKPYPPLEKRQPTPELVKEEKEDYKAIIEAKRGSGSPRFKIVTAGGMSYGCSYSHLLDWVYDPPTLLTLNTATRIFIIEGKNLETLERLLMEERVKEIHEFDPQRHLPPEAKTPIIESLKIEAQ